MTLQERLTTRINEKHLLTHTFYQMWDKGTLPIEVLRKYAEQYYHIERAFPTFLSLMLQTCDDEKVRAVIFDNLRDEAAGPKNHRELWLRFGEGVGATRESMKDSTPLPETAQAIETFKRLCSEHYTTGAAALASYESQIPAISEKKLEGLTAHYNITDKRTREFFVVHGVMDIKHSNVWWDMLETANLNEAEKAQMESAAAEGAKALWKFLDGIMREYMPETAMAC